MVVYKIFHIPTGKYVQSMTDKYNVNRYPSHAKIELGKKGKNWQTENGVLEAFNGALKGNCRFSVVPYSFQDFEIHQLELIITKKIKP